MPSGRTRARSWTAGTGTEPAASWASSPWRGGDFIGLRLARSRFRLAPCQHRHEAVVDRPGFLRFRHRLLLLLLLLLTPQHHPLAHSHHAPLLTFRVDGGVGNLHREEELAHPFTVVLLLLLGRQSQLLAEASV